MFTSNFFKLQVLHIIFKGQIQTNSGLKLTRAWCETTPVYVAD